MIRFILPLILLLAVNNCLAQKALSRQQAISDIDYYIRTMKASHYDPFRYISPDDYDTRIQEMKNSIGDSIPVKDFVLLCYRVTALLKDAHSTPALGQPVFQEAFKKEQFFPYKLVQDNNKVYAPLQLATDLGIPVGTEIIKINGENLSKLLGEVQQGIAGITSFREAASTKLIAYFFFLKGIQPPFILGYKDTKGMSQQAVVSAGVTFRKALSASLPHIIKPYDYELLQDKLGYIDVRTLSADINGFKSFLDTCFLKFKEAHIRHLAIDLRKNSGGNTLLGDLLFSYLTNKKYAWGMKRWRISEVYKNYLKADGDTGALYLQHPDGSIWKSEDGCLPVDNQFKQATKFEGDVYFITGPFTFSSAMAVVDVVREYKIGTLIGQPTGENVQDFGEAFVIELPDSKIKLQSTTSFSHGVNCTNTKNGPVLPDIIVRNNLQGEVSEIDTVLDYLLKRLK